MPWTVDKKHKKFFLKFIEQLNKKDENIQVKQEIIDQIREL